MYSFSAQQQDGGEITSAQVYDKLGNNFTSTASLPVTDFDIGDVETLSFTFTNLLDYANDSSTYGNNATLGYSSSDDSAEPAYNLSGYRGSGMVFDGVNDFANVSDAGSLDLTTTFTLSAWVNTKGSAGTTEIISKVAAGPTNGYRLRLLGNNSISFDLVDAAGIDSNNGTTLVTNNTWTHVAATNSNGTMIIYRNGDIVNRSTSLVIPRAGTSELHIGSAPIVVANFFNGTIDEVAIWNRTLNGAEINASKDVGPTAITNTNDLVLYLRFHEGSGILTCPADFSRAVITTNCGGISTEWSKVPKC